jgi:transposase
MDIVPKMSRAKRRELLRLGRRSGDLATALRFRVVARLGLGKTSPEVAEELDIARSTVVCTARCFADEGIAGLYDKRRGNGRPKADDAFRRRVAQLLQRTPEHFGWQRPTWTRELLCLQMKKHSHSSGLGSACPARRPLPLETRRARGSTRSAPGSCGASQRRRTGPLRRRGR